MLASEPVCIVGVDIAAPGQSRRNNVFSLDQIFKSFRDQFTEVEWQNIRCFGDERSQENAFRRNWSCKVGPGTAPIFDPPSDRIVLTRLRCAGGLHEGQGRRHRIRAPPVRVHHRRG